MVLTNISRAQIDGKHLDGILTDTMNDSTEKSALYEKCSQGCRIITGFLFVCVCMYASLSAQSEQ